MATREVLVVATDGFATDALAGTLRRDGWTVRRAPAGHEADAFRGRPAAIVLPAPPAALPAAVGRLRGLTDGVIVGVSAYAGPDARLAALAAGADDVLDPAAAEQELSVRLRVLVTRRAARDEVLAAGDVLVDLHAREATRGGRPLRLTPREFDLLAYLVANEGITVSRQAILDNVWRHGSLLSDSAVSVLVFRLRLKLEAAGERRLLHSVPGWGYVLRPQGTDVGVT
jgi:DNA-binding response OmpR family regulator